MNGSSSDMIKQIHAARKYCLNGLIIFDYAHLKNDYVQTLTESVFKSSKHGVVITPEVAEQVSTTQKEIVTPVKTKKHGFRKSER